MKAIVYEKTLPGSQCFVNLCLDVQLWIYIHLRMYISVYLQACTQLHTHGHAHKLYTYIFVYLQAYVRTHMRAVTHTWPCTQVVQEFLLEFDQRPKKDMFAKREGRRGLGKLLSYIKLQHSISQTPPEHERSMTVNS